MLIKRLKTFTVNMIAGANIATAIMMFLVGYSGHINPAHHLILSSVGLAFPFFILLNMGFLLFWAVFRWKYALISFIGFLVCFVPVRRYCPLNPSVEPPRDAIKVLSYNVWLFAGWDVHDGERGPILEYLRASDADIICLQEAEMNEIDYRKVKEAMSHYAYSDTSLSKKGSDCLALYSRYPILKKEQIKYVSENNHSVAHYLKVNGDTVIVINNHLESVGLSSEVKEGFDEMVRGRENGVQRKRTSQLLIGQIGAAAGRRASQAEAVANYVRNHRQYGIILCGDFNDSPISYAYSTIAGTLTDCFVETGCGPGFSYHHNSMHVRIDHIMCSDNFTPYNCKVDSKIDASDHYPIYCWLKKK